MTDTLIDSPYEVKQQLSGSFVIRRRIETQGRFHEIAECNNKEVAQQIADDWNKRLQPSEISVVDRNDEPLYTEILQVVSDAEITSMNDDESDFTVKVLNAVRPYLKREYGEHNLAEAIVAKVQAFLNHENDGGGTIHDIEQLAKKYMKGSTPAPQIGWQSMDTAPEDGEPFITRAEGWPFGIGIHDDEVGGFISLYGPDDWKRVTGWMRPTSIEDGSRP